MDLIHGLPRMTGRIINDHHVSRYCGGSHVTEDGRVSGTAFLPRGDETYLSVNWLEYFRTPDRQEQIEKVREILSQKLRIGSTAKIAVLNVGETKNTVMTATNGQIRIFVEHKPEPDDPSHAGICGLPLEDRLQLKLVAELMAQTIKEIYPAKI